MPLRSSGRRRGRSDRVGEKHFFVRYMTNAERSVQGVLALMKGKKGESSMDDEKRWQDMNSEEQAKRITELEHRIETLEAKIKAMETQETAKGLLTDTGAIG